jgi:hypothetical protein
MGSDHGRTTQPCLCRSFSAAHDPDICRLLRS